MKNNVKLSYLLGIFLGISVTILFFTVFSSKNSNTADINIQNDKLILENNELKLNGKVIPEEQLKMVLFMLVMGGFG